MLREKVIKSIEEKGTTSTLWALVQALEAFSSVHGLEKPTPNSLPRAGNYCGYPATFIGPIAYTLGISWRNDA